METGESLLLTKLFVPQVRSDRVARPSLVERLNEALSGKLTLISAPAGFGKTALVSEWLQQVDRPFAWFSLDGGDNDPNRFMTYLAAALQRVNSDWGEAAQELLRSPQPPALAAMMTALINEIVADNFPFVLILDDYHLVSAPPIHDALSLLLDRLPPTPRGMHLVILSRADPPIPLARLRACGEVTEIRADHLRFTSEEVHVLLNEVMRLDLTHEQITILANRTEGWIAGLQLAGLSLQGLLHDAVAGFIEAFSGSHRYVMDYLVEEVFSRQPPQIQDFLLKTSILDRLTGPLCDAVTGREDGQMMLEWLDTANLFIAPLDHERRWYRYHHLFADLLRDRLRWAQLDPTLVLHVRAAEWHEQHGLIAEAVGHALAASDFERAARSIEQSASEMLARGEIATVLRWIESLPAEVINGRPWLCIYQAWATAHTNRHDEAEDLLQRAEHLVGAECCEEEMPSLDLADQAAMRRILGYMAYIRARVASVCGDVSRAFKQLRKAYELLPEEDLFIRCHVAYVLGSTHLTSGELWEADRAFSEAARLGRAADNAHVAGIATVGLAKVRKLQGQLREAASYYREAAQMLAERGRQQSQAMGNVKLGMGDLLREWDDLESAKRHLQEGIECHQRWQNPSSLAFGYAILAQVLYAQQDSDGAFDALHKGCHLVRRYEVYPEMRSVMQAAEVRLWLAEGNLTVAARCIPESQNCEKGTPGFAQELDQITLVRLLIAQGKFDEALELLTRLAEAAEAEGRIGRLIEILVLQALGKQAMTQSAQAHSALRKALSLAEPEGYVRIFVDEGSPVAIMLSQLLMQSRPSGREMGGKYRFQGTAPGYIRRLLAALGEPAVDPPMAELLTRREIEILRLIAAGLKNQEIADHLVISVATVKRHTTNIYGKLEVTRRVQAIARARELGLL